MILGDDVEIFIDNFLHLMRIISTNAVRIPKKQAEGTPKRGSLRTPCYSLQTKLHIQFWICQSHIISSRLYNPCYVYHYTISVQNMFGFHLCSYSVPYITMVAFALLSSKEQVKIYGQIKLHKDT